MNRRRWAFRHQINQKRWRHIRRLVLQRDQWKCRQCERRGRLEVDHIIPIYKGGSKYDFANLQVLCRDCHFAKSSAEQDPSSRGKSAAGIKREKELVKMYRDML